MKKIYIILAIAVILVLIGFMGKDYLREKKIRQEISACQPLNKQVVCDCPNCQPSFNQATSSLGVYYNEKYHYFINYFSDLSIDDFGNGNISFRGPNGGPWSMGVQVNPGTTTVAEYLKKQSDIKIIKTITVNGNTMTIINPYTGKDGNSNSRQAIVKHNNALFLINTAYPEISDQVFNSFRFMDFLQ
jgi:hypothetical protein